MDIRTYLQTSGTTQQALAVAVGVTQGMVFQWITGRRRVAAERCQAIETATGRMVTKQELRPDIFGPPEKRKRKAVAA